MWCDPDLAIALAIANQDHGLDGYVVEALILSQSHSHSHSQVHEHMLMGLAPEHMLMGQAHEHMFVDLAMAKIRIRIHASPT